MSPTAFSAADSFKSAQMTWEPSWAKRSAVSRPMPEAAPVTLGAGERRDM